VPVSSNGLVVLMGIGAFLIALWIDYRLPSLAPKTFVGTLAHLFAAMATGNFVVPLVVGAVGDDSLSVVFGVFGVGFPVLVYLFLAGVWLIKYGQRALGGFAR
jgi:hypothetical protein